MKRNAIILAAGTSSRFVPLSYEYPKGLLEVRGEILIERQIRQLLEAGIDDITIVVGYMASKFLYLKEKYGVNVIYNEDYAQYNNSSSMIRVIDRLENTYICSSDNYFPENVFKGNPVQGYYSVLYSEGPTDEYCICINSRNEIDSVTIGGHDSWYMVGHVYFDADFSKHFNKLFKEEYENPETRKGYWEDVYIRHLESLPRLQINKYNKGQIEEFDSLDELRLFDESYKDNTHSEIISFIAEKMGCKESDLYGFSPVKTKGTCDSFIFLKNNKEYIFITSEKSIFSL